MSEKSCSPFLKAKASHLIGAHTYTYSSPKDIPNNRKNKPNIMFTIKVNNNIGLTSIIICPKIIKRSAKSSCTLDKKINRINVWITTII